MAFVLESISDSRQAYKLHISRQGEAFQPGNGGLLWMRSFKSTGVDLLSSGAGAQHGSDMYPLVYWNPIS